MDKPTPKYRIGEKFILEGKVYTITEVNIKFNGKFHYVQYVAQDTHSYGPVRQLSCVEENLDEWFQNSLRFIFD